MLLGLAFVSYGLAYRYYGGYLKKLFQVDEKRKTPAETNYDGVDYVPAKNWYVLFGHHFSAICGAGPIVGPVLACAYWGWVPSILWILLGAVWMGAVADFSALMMSLRHNGESITQVAGAEVSKRARLYGAIFVWIALILVISVFAIFTAKTFIEEPNTVVPSVGLVPTAFFVGWMMYRKKISGGKVTLLGLLILAALLWVGMRWPITISSWGGWSPEMIWIGVLFIYCFAASVMPVQLLLQPRDYLASFILFAMIVISTVCVFWTRPVISAPAFTAFSPSESPEAGPLWPMLFVTLACGAISGFHSLISSGTTSKQLESEGHALRISYGSMLTESLVAVLVVIIIAGCLSQNDLKFHLKQGGPITVFGYGFGKLTEGMLGSYGKVFSILAVNAFVFTTLDAATRIARYITSELFGISNKYIATLMVVGASSALALTGQWNRLWPAFGAANQLIGVITLLVASCWLLARGRNFYVTMIPAFLMLATTVGAFLYQLAGALRHSPSPNWVLAGICFVLIILALSLFFETMRKIVFRIRSLRGQSFLKGASHA
ncbi:MAG: carbon starvation protein A [Candidatus Omnitrophica bacterium]|nr:carbon starvation protein A [Candidatus Omnitrophota bacterium]